MNFNKKKREELVANRLPFSKYTVLKLFYIVWTICSKQATKQSQI